MLVFMFNLNTNVAHVATKVVQSQMAILGSQIAISKAQEIPGLLVSENGIVTSIKGKPREVLQLLVSKYTSLSGEIVKNIIKPIVSCYPEIYFDEI